jgi:hypothetical protein
MGHRAGELRTGPAACEADDAEGWPGSGSNDVVVTAMSLGVHVVGGACRWGARRWGARRCGNDAIEAPTAVAGGDRTGRRGGSARNGRSLYPLLARASRFSGMRSSCYPSIRGLRRPGDRRYAVFTPKYDGPDSAVPVPVRRSGPGSETRASAHPAVVKPGFQALGYELSRYELRRVKTPARAPGWRVRRLPGRGRAAALP